MSGQVSDKDLKKTGGAVDPTITPIQRITLLRKLRAKVAIRKRLTSLINLLSLSIGRKSESETSYSQFGEDVIVNRLFKDFAYINISYLDIGANNPKFISNTYLFYEQGFSGVLVEPNSALCEKLRAERPNDVVLNVGVGVDDSVNEADFYLFSGENDGLSTFSQKEAMYWEEVGMGGIPRYVEQIVRVPLMNINDIISDYFSKFPDFVSIDVEGWDLKILQTFDFKKYSPAIFCVETLAYNTDGSTYRIQSIYDLLDGKDYFPYRETFANTIFVNKNLYESYLYQRKKTPHQI